MRTALYVRARHAAACRYARRVATRWRSRIGQRRGSGIDKLVSCLFTNACSVASVFGVRTGVTGTARSAALSIGAQQRDAECAAVAEPTVASMCPAAARELPLADG